MNKHQFAETQIAEAQQFCQKHNRQMVKSLGTGTPMCPDCCHEQTHARHNQELRKSIRVHHFAGAQIPQRHALSGFKNYIVSTNEQYSAKHKTHSFAKTILSGQSKNLVMVGSTGTGKTHLGCAVANNLLSKGFYARYITSEAMANDIADAYKRNDDNEKNSILRYVDTDLLILDEYGLHDRHENRPRLLEMVHKVLYARYDAMKPTMLISNMSLAQLKTDLGDRLWSRFQDGGLTVVECNWADARVKQL